MSYTWRDPARNTPAVLDALAERDRRRALLERAPDPGGQATRRQAAIARFAGLRATGMSISQAADAMGINRSTGRSYARALRKRP